jgi:hypothetical protein
MKEKEETIQEVFSSILGVHYALQAVSLAQRKARGKAVEYLAEAELHLKSVMGELRSMMESLHEGKEVPLIFRFW